LPQQEQQQLSLRPSSASSVVAAAANNPLHRRLTEAFTVFDHEQNRTVDAREVGAILRSLGNLTIFYEDPFIT